MYTLRHSTRVRSSTPPRLLRERDVGRGADGCFFGSRKALTPEMDSFFVGDRFANRKTSE